MARMISRTTHPRYSRPRFPLSRGLVVASAALAVTVPSPPALKVDSVHGKWCTCHMCAPQSAQKVSKP